MIKLPQSYANIKIIRLGNGRTLAEKAKDLIFVPSWLQLFKNWQADASKAKMENSLRPRMAFS